MSRHQASARSECREALTASRTRLGAWRGGWGGGDWDEARKAEWGGTL